MFVLRLWAVVFLCSCLVSGCSTGPKLASVEGTVTLDGQPLKNGTITFESTGQRPATARIVNGQIVEATTYNPGDGVPVGDHNVAISATEDASSAVAADPGQAQAPGANYMGGKSLIPARYNNPSTSQLKAEVRAGQKNVLKFELTSK